MDRCPDGGIAAAAGTATGHRVGVGRGDRHRHWFSQKPPAPPGIGLRVVGQNSRGGARDRVFLLVLDGPSVDASRGDVRAGLCAGTIAKTNESGSAAPTSRGSARGAAGAEATARLDPATSAHLCGEGGRHRWPKGGDPGGVFNPRRLAPFAIRGRRAGTRNLLRGGRWGEALDGGGGNIMRQAGVLGKLGTGRSERLGKPPWLS